MRWLSSALLSYALLSCGGSTDTDSGTGGNGGTGGTSTGGNAGTGGTSSGGSGGVAGCTSLVPCCDANDNPVEHLCQNGMPVCPPGASFPPSGVCGGTSSSCSPSQPCQSDEYCDYGDNKCGAGQPGSCKQRPRGCDLLYAPVCGCDGKVAGNACAAYSSGTDLNDNGGCPAAAGTFSCGSIFCEHGTQYCQRATSDVGGYPDSFTCLPLPTSCGSAPSCACLATEPCGTLCAETDAGQLTLTCPGG